MYSHYTSSTVWGTLPCGIFVFLQYKFYCIRNLTMWYFFVPTIQVLPNEEPYHVVFSCCAGNILWCWYPRADWSEFRAMYLLCERTCTGGPPILRLLCSRWKDKSKIRKTRILLMGAIHGKPSTYTYTATKNILGN